jgi:hypothetical protein
MAKYNNQGWHRQSVRHSDAKRTGRAGGIYANSNWRHPKDVYSDENKNKSFGELKKKGVFLPYQGDADKDGVKNIKDCKPLDADKQGWLHKERIKKH